jgi:hypothetical protein
VKGEPPAAAGLVPLCHLPAPPFVPAGMMNPSAVGTFMTTASFFPRHVTSDSTTTTPNLPRSDRIRLSETKPESHLDRRTHHQDSPFPVDLAPLRSRLPVCRRRPRQPSIRYSQHSCFLVDAPPEKYQGADDQNRSQTG